MTRRQLFTAAIGALIAVGCGKPGVSDLRESFARQLAANTFIKDFQQSGDELRFTGPVVEGSATEWRVHFDSAAIEPNSAPDKPYKGVVKSSWYAGGHKVEPTGGDSNLPTELISTGLAQECWALWNQATQKWEWE